jgi:uncharacterized protein YndB with AHSA1/START domain
MTVIEHEIMIEAPIETVWRTITEPDQIRLWFAEDVSLDLHPGGDGVLIFEGPHRAPLVVEAVEPPSRFAFRWNHPEGVSPTPSNSLLVEFTLVASAGDRTLLRVCETGVENLDWSTERKTDYVDDHRKGWARGLGRLHDLLAGA